MLFYFIKKTTKKYQMKKNEKNRNKLKCGPRQHKLEVWGLN
jgi:hypothetical protein